jgi:predicted protein tyrosine phosphatase
MVLPMTLHALFICGKARMRSPTAAAIAARWAGVATDFAGLSNDADEPIGPEQLDWADVICVMDARQAKRVASLFPTQLRGKRIVVLNVPDTYGFMEDALVARLTPLLRSILIG